MAAKDIKARNTVDLLLRTTQQNHLELSVMADQKADIIIAFCSLVLKNKKYPYLKISYSIFLTGLSLSAMIFILDIFFK